MERQKVTYVNEKRKIGGDGRQKIRNDIEVGVQRALTNYRCTMRERMLTTIASC
jgi:hypothetical protein